MGHGQGTIFSPNIDPYGDVAPVLGRNTGDVPLLCSDQEYYDTGEVDGDGNPIYAKRDAGCVKPWPKFKPIRHSNDTILTLADRQDKYFGFDVTPCGPNGNLANFLARYADEWKYLKPRGIDVTPIEWCRILDFDGYNAGANAFVYPNGCTIPSGYTVGQGGTGVTFQLAINTGNNLNAGSISIDDFKLGGSDAGNPTFRNCYFGLIFVRGNDFRKIITSANILGYNGSTSDIFISESSGSLSGLTTGNTYTIYPILSLLPHTSLTNFANTDMIVSLPLLGARSFEVKSPQTSENISIRSASAWLGIRARIEYSVEVGHMPAAQSVTVVCYVYAASGPDDRTGTLLDTRSSYFSGTTVFTPASPLNVSNPGWLRIYCNKENVPSIYAETFVQISQEEPE